MEQLLACIFREVANGSLSNAILRVCIYPTKGELLSCIMACLVEGAVVELPIVVVLVKNLDPVLCGVLFKGKLGSHCFLR